MTLKHVERGVYESPDGRVQVRKENTQGRDVWSLYVDGHWVADGDRPRNVLSHVESLLSSCQKESK